MIEILTKIHAKIIENRDINKNYIKSKKKLI